MQNQSLTIASLRNLIGHEVRFEGQLCKIIEILEDGPHLILQHKEQSTAIQADQHGEAHRRVPTTITLPVMDNEGRSLSSDFHSLEVNHLLS